jgi:hypothetical protein
MIDWRYFDLIKNRRNQSIKLTVPSIDKIKWINILHYGV